MLERPRRPPRRAPQPQRRPGGAPPSSTRSTSAASPTATATASATWPASGPGCPTCATSGVDAIWITPFYPSPMADGGYDVADYRDIEPLFGTLADADALIARGARPRPAGHRRHRPQPLLGPAPSGSRRRWRPGPGSPRARALHLPAGARDRTARCRRTTGSSTFGGPAWTRLPDGEWYLHLFAPEQPDFDWENPEVVEEFQDILRFWLDRGVDGFRIDVANSLKKDQTFPDVGPEDERASSCRTRARPPVLGPRRRARGLPRLAQGQRRVRRRPGLRRRGLGRLPRAAGPLHPAGRAAHGVQLQLRPRALGRRRAALDHRRVPGRSRPRSGRRRPGCCPTTTSPGTPRGTAGWTPPAAACPTSDRVGPDTPLDPALGLRRARAAALLMLALPGLGLRLPGRGARAARGRRPARGGSRRPDLGALGPHRARAATAAGCRSRGPGRRSVASASAPARPGCRSRRRGPSCRCEAQQGVEGSTLELYRARARGCAARLAVGEDRCEWLDCRARGTLSFRADDGRRRDASCASCQLGLGPGAAPGVRRGAARQRAGHCRRRRRCCPATPRSGSGSRDLTHRGARFVPV